MNRKKILTIGFIIVGIILMFTIIYTSSRNKGNNVNTQTDVISDVMNRVDDMQKETQKKETVITTTIIEQETRKTNQDSEDDGWADYPHLNEKMLIGTWSPNFDSNDNKYVTEFYYDNDGNLRFYSYLLLNYNNALDGIKKGDISEGSYGKAYIGFNRMIYVSCENCLVPSNVESFDIYEMNEGKITEQKSYPFTYKKVSDDRLSVPDASKTRVDSYGNVLPSTMSIQN